MRRALLSNWTLFLGMTLLMVGNGLMVTLVTLRGNQLGFSTLNISLMQAAYPVGALIGTMLTPLLIARVGHIRVFSALASTVSITAVVYMVTSDAISWGLMRLLGGMCFPGIYVITESWLNAQSQNSFRAQLLSVYFIIQMAGPAVGTAMAGLPDPSGTLLFGIAAILISFAVVPLLLSNVQAPPYQAPERMPVRKLARISPITVHGIVIMCAGVAAWYISLPLIMLHLGVHESQAAMALVFALLAGAVVQYPVGWLSDRIDRRLVVAGLSLISALAALWLVFDRTTSHQVVGFAIIAGATLPIYGLLAAHANDRLQPGQIIPASGTMVFLLQLGQVFGMLIGPNLVDLAGGRGLQMTLAVIGLLVMMLSIRRLRLRAAPAETGEAMPIGGVGMARTGLLQGEALRIQKHDGIDEFYSKKHL